MEKIKLSHKSYSITVYHKQGETDEKLVFLHGGGLDNAMLSWKEVIEMMGNRYDIYAIDMLGYGESDKPDIVYTIPMYVEFLYDILKQLAIEKTHLAGLSLGGAVSIGFSLRYPHMVNKLGLVSAWGYTDRFQFHEISRWFVNSRIYLKSYDWMRKSRKLVRWSIESTMIGEKKKVTDEMVDSFYSLVQNPEDSKPWVSLQQYEMGKKKVTTDLASHLNELKMPVLIVNGEKDPAVPVKSAINAGKAIENSKLYIMKGCKHLPQIERPEEFIPVLKEFLLDGDI